VHVGDPEPDEKLSDPLGAARAEQDAAGSRKGVHQTDTSRLPPRPRARRRPLQASRRRIDHARL